MADHSTLNDAGQPPCERCHVLHTPLVMQHVPLYEPAPAGTFWHAPRFVWLCESCHDTLLAKAHPRRFLTIALWESLPPVAASRLDHLADRNRRIRRQREQGTPVAELVRRHKLSRERIYQILRE